MIKILPIKKEKIEEPYYLLTFNYMIGDADGSEIVKTKINVDNPLLEEYFKFFKKLKPKLNHSYIKFDNEYLKENKDVLSPKEYKMLKNIIDFDNMNQNDKNYNNICEIIDGGSMIISERDIGGFLLESFSLQYVDSEGIHETEII